MPTQRRAYPIIEVVYISAPGDYFRASSDELAAWGWQYQKPPGMTEYVAHKLDCQRSLTDEEVAAYVASCPDQWGKQANGQFDTAAGFSHYLKPRLGQ